MKTIVTWLPKKVVNEIAKHKDTQVFLSIVKVESGIFDVELTKEQIEYLYRDELNKYYVNGEFVCFNI